MAEITVHPGRTALVIVDMQHCFVADSPIAAPQSAELHPLMDVRPRDVVVSKPRFGSFQREEVLSRIPAAVTAAAEA